jgi:DNA repair exonuclease SbcCD ATPase subunit
LIQFKRLSYKNFLACGNVPIEINLDSHQKTIIIGDNGHGKSTIISALTFALFGKDFRGMNKPALVNSINKRGLEVEVEFETRGKLYKIRRGMGPNIFEIYLDGSLLNQTAYARDYQKYIEENVLKLNFNTFKQIVVLGANNYIPFMKLVTSARRAIIEDLLDITVFSKMNWILKDKIAETKDLLENLDNQIKNETQKFHISRDHLKQLAKTNELKLSQTEEDIEQQRQIIEDQMLYIDTLLAGKKLIQDKINQFTAIDTEIKRMAPAIGKVTSNIHTLNKSKDFLEKNSKCTTCNQPIDEHFKECELKRIQEELDNDQSVLGDFQEYNKELDQAKAQHDLITKDLSNIMNKILDAQSTINISTKLIQKIENDRKSAGQIDQAHIDALKEKLHDQIKIIEELKEQKKAEILRRELENVAFMLLKDTGIKTKIIQNYIPYMNKMINDYLATMDFYVSFELDENFDEKIRSRHRDVFSYENFSSGERQRIDLAILFTWREIARKKNSMAINILFLDEVGDSSLDNDGVENMMKIINTLKDTNVFVISHKDALVDKFDRAIRFKKHNNFSVIEHV